jgi:UDPglucose 6-dehydrogenase
MIISIIGLGFVGTAMEKSFKIKNIKMNNYDKYKNGGIGNINNILKSNICFLCLPTLFNKEKKEYDKTSIIETIEFLNKNNYKGIVVIKSTIEPETSLKLKKLYNLKLVHNPEFLTARNAFTDFHNQKHIVLGKTDLNDNIDELINFYKDNYNSKISICSALESESMKLFCNSFYAVKIQFFNELYLLCLKNSSNFNTIKNLMLENNWINPMHTNVPGPDGKLSYGGACFPKDTNALNEYMIKYNSENKILNSTIIERNHLRDDN